MEASDGDGGLRRNAIALPQALFQSITHMAPGAAIAFSLLVSIQFAGPALPLSVLLALVGCVCVAASIGQLAKEMPSAGGLYTYVARSLGPQAGFMVGWAYLLFEPLVAPLLFLIFAWTTKDMVSAQHHGLHWTYTGQWWIWVLLSAGIVFFLTYRDVRLSTRAGVILGVFEVTVFVALSLWMILSNPGRLTLQTFNPDRAAGGTYRGIFKGMVFAVLAFIGFESAAPLGEEARNPRWTIPRAVVGSAVGIGLFYVFCSYAWVIGTGFDRFTTAATSSANPWRDLGIVFWSGGWVLIFAAIVNSALANSNAGVTAASRVMYSLGRNGVLPRAFGRTHPVHRTPHVAIVAQTAFGVAVALLLGWRYGDLITAFTIIATTITIVVIVVYIVVCASTIVYFARRPEHTPWLHWLVPILGAAVFIPPLYYQYFPLPPYPIRSAVWIALGWIVAGIVVTAFVPRRVLDDVDRLFVE
ncbi:MAG TPA: APC family permease [Gaiellaceae bacterium]|nr:APC family permease [Gaiellaceae bacterium]